MRGNRYLERLKTRQPPRRPPVSTGAASTETLLYVVDVAEGDEVWAA